MEDELADAQSTPQPEGTPVEPEAHGSGDKSRLTGRARSLANLRPAWTSETAPRTQPKPGRPEGAKQSVLAHLRQLVAEDADVGHLRDVARRASYNRRVAARLMLDALHGEPDIRRRALAELLDRTEGKAVQVQAVLQADVTDPATLLARAQAEARVAVVGYDMPAALPPPAPRTTADPPDDDAAPRQGER